MLNCRELSDRITDHMEGQTGRWQRFQVAMHLLLCGHCRRFFRQMKLVSGVVGEPEASMSQLSGEEAARLADTIRERSGTAGEQSNREENEDEYKR